MVEAKRVPQYQIGILNAAVGLCPFGKTASAPALIGVRPRRESFLLMKRRYPEMIVGESGTLLGKIVRA